MTASLDSRRLCGYDTAQSVAEVRQILSLHHGGGAERFAPPFPYNSQ